MTKRKDITKWCIPVTTTLDEALELAVARDSHISKSDFVRDAVRRKLEEMGFKSKFLNQRRLKNEWCEVSG